MVNSLDSKLNLRVDRVALSQFAKKAKRSGTTHAVLLRNMIDAYNSGKLRILTDDDTLEIYCGH